MRTHASLLALICLSLSTVAVQAENKFCLGGETANLSAAQRKTCNSQIQAARSIVARSHVQNWHFIVVCGEDNWSDYSSFSHNDPKALADLAVDTVYEDRTTFLRGDMLMNVTSPTYTRVIAAISQLEPVTLADAR